MDNRISEILAAYNHVNLDEKIQFELDGAIEKEIKSAYRAENFEFCISCIDYTTLKVTDTEASVKHFVAELLKKLKKHGLGQVASVCVFPNFAAVVREALKSHNIKTTVVAGNFPNSQTYTAIKLAECKLAIEHGAQEVDVVIPVGDILEKNYDKAYHELKAIREVCKDVCLKVILETGEIKDIEGIFNAALIGAYAGADFIKTSTGKVPVNATPEAVYVICEALKQFYKQTGRRVGIKVAGGVTKTQNAIRYLTIVNQVLGKEWLTPEYFRLGASQLMEDIIKEIKAVQLVESKTGI